MEKHLNTPAEVSSTRNRTEHTKSPEPGHKGHGTDEGEQGARESHDKHAGHSPEMFKNRFWLSLALSLPVIYYAAFFQDIFGYRAAQFPGSGWVGPVLGTVLYFYGGWPFLQGAVHELRARQPGMMTLVALAISVAFGYSVAVTLGLPGTPFYWELATLVVIMLLGHWLEMASVQRAGRALEHLASLVPSTAHKFAGEKLEDVSVTGLRTGDRILIRPGEQVPVDGVVREGASSLNEAFLTGESRPVSKSVGDEVIAGAVNGEGALTAEVTRTGDDTTLSQIQRLVAEAQGSRSRFQNLADRAAAWLFYLALAAGTLTFVVWFAVADLQTAITRAVTVLVIACPHALGLAIPLVTVNATAMSAKNGILVRNREAFERARDLKIVAFDKTGTLTEGAFGVRQVYTVGLPEDGSEDEALRLAAGLEARSEHPLGRAVADEAERRGLESPTVQNFSVTAGQSVEGTLNGRSYRIGRAEWAADLVFPEPLRAGLDEAEARGESVIVLMDDRSVLALFALADRVRRGAKEAVRQLQKLGVEPVMITGDAEAVAATVARDLGIAQFYARVLPKDKADIVRRLKRKGHTAFVGDGINDAPALLEADLGVAIGAGTDVATESADLVLIENDPLDVLAALKLSKATYAKMLQNLVWATGYNAVALPLAAGVLAFWGVLLSPAVGAVLMSVSTIIVAVNATLLRRVKLGGA